MEATTDLRNHLGAIEADVDAARYCAGSWARFVRQVRQRPQGERLSLAADISRVSRKLHSRNHRRTLSVSAGVSLELLATVVGGFALAIGFARHWNLLVLAAAAVWVTTFQPLIKLLVGTALGVRYDYAYLQGVEPRFKMRYGTYVAAPRWGRIVVHASGTVGSPLAAGLVGRLAQSGLPLASGICVVAFCTTVVLNAALFIAVFVGRSRLGSLRLRTTSGGAAAIELREALGWDT